MTPRWGRGHFLLPQGPRADNVASQVPFPLQSTGMGRRVRAVGFQGEETEPLARRGHCNPGAGKHRGTAAAWSCWPDSKTGQDEGKAQPYQSEPKLPRANSKYNWLKHPEPASLCSLQDARMDVGWRDLSDHKGFCLLAKRWQQHLPLQAARASVLEPLNQTSNQQQQQSLGIGRQEGMTMLWGICGCSPAHLPALACGFEAAPFPKGAASPARLEGENPQNKNTTARPLVYRAISSRK